MRTGQLSKTLAEQLRENSYKIVPSKGPNRHDRRKLKATARKEAERAALNAGACTKE
jgi:hypothetical protein